MDFLNADISDMAQCHDRVRWLFFDLDDTLWDFSANSDRALKLLFNQSDILNDAFGSFNEFSDVYHRHNDILWRDYANGAIDADSLKRLRFENTLRDARKSYSASPDPIGVCYDLNERYLNLLVEGKRLIPGAIETLQLLQLRYLLGILSNGFRDTQYKKLYSTPLNRYITRLITSAEADATKPDRQIFEYALRATGADAQSSVMIGDNADTDIRGAIDAGLKAIYFHRHPEKVIPDAIVNLKGNRLFLGTITDIRELTGFFA